MKFQRGYCKMATSRKTSGNWEISVSSPTHLEVQLQLQTIEKLLLRNLWSCPSTKWWPASNSASQHDLIYIAGRSHPYGYKPQTVSSPCQVYFFITLIPTHHWKFLSFKNHQVGYSELSGLCFLPVGKFGHQTQTIFLPPRKQKTSPYLLFIVISIISMRITTIKADVIILILKPYIPDHESY